ncbi:lytic transglycosylase domain-containing protein [Lentzea sp.]|uniref:lytic transglycosylase domain-containing protein n=1 Tax=Lentzea sp. TaxID=56099 RepID=UPI002ED53EBA
MFRKSLSRRCSQPTTRIALTLVMLASAGASTPWYAPPDTASSSPDEPPRTALSSAGWDHGAAWVPAAEVVEQRAAAPVVAAVKPGPGHGAVVAPGAGVQGIPGNVLGAYRAAAEFAARTSPRCNLPWHLLASIGRIESRHARGGRTDAAGTTSPAILGPVLAGGPGMAAIRDTDGGRWDGDGQWDRAVGPMQFIPGTWAYYGTDGNGDGIASPHNVFDATAAAARYLCSGGLDMSRPNDARAAVFRYNHSDSYVRTVIAWSEAYATGAREVPAALVDHAVDQTARPPAPAVAVVSKPGKENVAAPKPETAKPDAPKPDAPKPETSKPEKPKPAETPAVAAAAAPVAVAPAAPVAQEKPLQPKPSRRPTWLDGIAAPLLKICLKKLSRPRETDSALDQRCTAVIRDALNEGIVTEQEVAEQKAPATKPVQPR